MCENFKSWIKSNFKKINSWLIVSLSAFLLIWVVLNVVFPSFSYSINKTDSFKISVLKKDIGGEDFLSITPLFDYPYQKIDVKIDLRGGAGGQENLPVFYGYEAEFYPVSEKMINTSHELGEYLFFGNESLKPNGSLVSGKDAVFFISKGLARPFLGPEVFLRLGFDWDDVEQDSEGVLSDLESGDKINFTSAHPDGTFLRFSDGGIYLVWEGQLIEVGSQAKQKLSEQSKLIQVEKREKLPAGECVAVKSTSRKLSCKVGGVRDFQASGHTYLFEIPDDGLGKIEDAKIEFSMMGNFNRSVAQESLKRVKDSLYDRYKDYVLN